MRYKTELMSKIRLFCKETLEEKKHIHLLGDDFHSWRTDCINFYDTDYNRKKVIDFFESYNLEWKIEERVVKMKGAKRIE